VSSSDPDAREDAWARHYRVASERRRARGWHRREEARPHGRRIARRWLYAGAVVAFIALSALALVLPR
jgi:hypothetical protein